MAKTAPQNRKSNGPASQDSPIRWAMTAYRLSNGKGSVTGVQQRGDDIFVCVRNGEDTHWVRFQKVMTRQELMEWCTPKNFR